MHTFAPVLKTGTLPFTSGIRHMLLSTISFAVMNVFIKKVSHFPAMEVVFFRCFISMLICFALIYQAGADWKGSNRKLLLARGYFRHHCAVYFFITLHNIPLGTAVTIQYLSPIFTTVIAIFLLREKVKLPQWVFFALSFAGILIIKGFDHRISVNMLLIGIASALASGFAYNMVRSLKEKEHTMVVVLHFQIIGALTGLFFMLFNFRMPSGIEWFYLLMIGITTQLGQVNLTKALQQERIANVSIFNYLGIIYALLFGFFFFDERYEWLSLWGIVLVLAGVLLNYMYQLKQQKIVAEEELSGVEE